MDCKNTLAENMKIFGDTTVIASASIESLIEDTPNIKELYLIIPEKVKMRIVPILPYIDW